MMKELLTQSLAQIVNHDHRAAAVFEKYQLDFCCNGKRTLGQACTEAELDPELIMTALEGSSQPATETPVDFNSLSLSQLADYIVDTHHAYLRKEMPLIAMYLQKVTAKHSGRHPELSKILELFMALKEEMDQHMQKEEVVLFPRIREMEKQVETGLTPPVNITYLKSPVSLMEQEHDQAGAAMAEIRQLSSGYNPPDDACTTYRLCYASLHAFELDLHRHVHLENNRLFPKALQLFASSKSAALN